MATTTPNFGWPVPTSTDLVKNGATAIEALGDAIDASMADLEGGTTGQVLAKASNADMDFAWVVADDTNAIQNSIVDAKGDLIAATANDTPARLAVGSNGQALVADSTAATGLKYSSNAPSGGMSIINTGGTNLTGASTITVSGFSNLSRLCVIVNDASSASASSEIRIRFNSDTNANYGYAGLWNNGGAINSAKNISATYIPMAIMGISAGDITSAVFNVEGCFSAGLQEINLGSSASGTASGAFNWSAFYIGNAQITSVSLISSTGNFDNGAIYVYGV